MTGESLRRRIAAVEAAAGTGPQIGGIVRWRPGAETARQAAERAIAEGRTGFALLPEPATDAETWSAQAEREQAELARRAAVFLAGTLKR